MCANEEECCCTETAFEGDGAPPANPVAAAASAAAARAAFPPLRPMSRGTRIPVAPRTLPVTSVDDAPGGIRRVCGRIFAASRQQRVRRSFAHGSIECCVEAVAKGGRPPILHFQLIRGLDGPMFKVEANRSSDRRRHQCVLCCKQRLPPNHRHRVVVRSIVVPDNSHPMEGGADCVIGNGACDSRP